MINVVGIELRTVGGSKERLHDAATVAVAVADISGGCTPVRSRTYIAHGGFNKPEKYYNLLHHFVKD